MLGSDTATLCERMGQGEPMNPPQGSGTPPPQSRSRGSQKSHFSPKIYASPLLLYKTPPNRRATDISRNHFLVNIHLWKQWMRIKQFLGVGGVLLCVFKEYE